MSENVKMNIKETKIIADMEKAIKELTTARTIDSFLNSQARLGVGTNSQTQNSGYFLTRFTFDYRQLTALYRNNWVVQKGIDIPAKDMVRHGIKLESKIKPEEIKKLERGLSKTNQEVISGIKWGRLYGGALGVLLLDDINAKRVDPKDNELKPVYELPLDIDLISVNSFKGIFIIDRWNGVSPIGELVSDLGDSRFGFPEFFQVYLPNQDTVKVHHSWVLDFSGIETPRIEKYADVYWGMSVVEPVYEELKKYDGTNYSIAELVYQASLRVVKFKDLANAVGTGSESYQKELKSKLQLMAETQTNQGITALDTNDNFEVTGANFANLDKIMAEYKINVSGAFNMPVTKLFGIPGNGFTSDDKSGETNYYEYIQGEQERNLRQNYNKLLKVISKSSLGYVPEDIEDFDFNYLGDITDKNASRSLAKDKIDTILNAFDKGVIDRATAQKELAQVGDDYGLFTNITDETIEETKKEQEEFDLGEKESENIMTEDAKPKRKFFGIRKK